jgi:DNA-binding GntR family transcriptional regulator
MFDQLVQLDKQTHHLFSQNCDNNYLYSLLGNIETKIRQMQYLSVGSDNILETIEQHSQILEAMLDNDPELAQKRLIYHFQYALEYIMGRSDQVSSSSGQMTDSFFSSVFGAKEPSAEEKSKK